MPATPFASFADRLVPRLDPLFQVVEHPTGVIAYGSTTGAKTLRIFEPMTAIGFIEGSRRSPTYYEPYYEPRRRFRVPV